MVVKSRYFGHDVHNGPSLIEPSPKSFTGSKTLRAKRLRRQSRHCPRVRRRLANPWATMADMTVPSELDACSPGGRVDILAK